MGYRWPKARFRADTDRKYHIDHAYPVGHIKNIPNIDGLKAQ